MKECRGVGARVALVPALASMLCACQSNGAGSAQSQAAGLEARDWVGTHDAPAVSPASGAPDAATGSWVLHVGDSFVEASFAQNLAERFRAAGARQVAFGKTATYTTTWAGDVDLDHWLARRPSLVLVTLGANEVDNTVPRLHAPAIRAVARKAGAVAPCVWIGPPLWKDDRPGWLQVIHDNCAPCLFFDSDAVLGGLGVDERRGDRIHPNEKGGARWAEAFWEWLQEHRDPERGPWALVPYERR